MVAMTPRAGAAEAAADSTTADAPAPPSAETANGEAAAAAGNHSRILRHTGDFHWQGVPLEPYKDSGDTWRGITRRELSGTRGESQRFHVRYFELEPGGYSSFERHDHEHVVIPLRGRGEVRIGDAVHAVGFGDVVYIAPGDAHQFRNPAASPEPFGFLCMVNAERDAPRPVEGDAACEVCA
jgi:quercetin dioxygenase-like cupin family protein